MILLFLLPPLSLLIYSHPSHPVSSPAYPVVSYPTLKGEYSQRGAPAPLIFLPLSFSQPPKERGTQGVRFINLYLPAVLML
jgi:hypothetical protein